LSNIFKYLLWQVKLFYFILFYLESFSENVNLIKQKHYSESINMIVLKFIINIHNYQIIIIIIIIIINYIYIISIGIIYLNSIIYVKILI